MLNLAFIPDEVIFNLESLNWGWSYKFKDLMKRQTDRPEFEKWRKRLEDIKRNLKDHVHEEAKTFKHTYLTCSEEATVDAMVILSNELEIEYFKFVDEVRKLCNEEKRSKTKYDWEIEQWKDLAKKSN